MDIIHWIVINIINKLLFLIQLNNVIVSLCSDPWPSKTLAPLTSAPPTLKIYWYICIMLLNFLILDGFNFHEIESFYLIFKQLQRIFKVSSMGIDLRHTVAAPLQKDNLSNLKQLEGRTFIQSNQNPFRGKFGSWKGFILFPYLFCCLNLLSVHLCFF